MVVSSGSVVSDAGKSVQRHAYVS